ncbi:MAG: MogA/MoaB family molybdenum cofactor biosynthesis protein [Promethearchaeota archaeon]
MAKSTKEKHIVDKNLKVYAISLIISDSLSKLSEKKRNKIDKSGKISKQKCKDLGYEFLGLYFVPDEPEKIRNFIKKQLLNNDLNLIITIGGTGLSSRDLTIETLRPMFDKELDGFGELFRYLTYKQIGTVSIMTRATAGIINKKIILCLPGSPNAVELGIDIISKEMLHLLNIIRK